MFGPFDPKWIDVFFNGRPADPQPEPANPRKLDGATIAKLVLRGTSKVRCEGKVYEITVREL